MGEGVHAKLAVEPGCRAGEIAAEVGARDVVPGGGSPTQLVVEPETTDRPELEEVVASGDAVVCRVDATTCRGEAVCPSCRPRGLPVEPYRVTWRGGNVLLNIAAADADEVRDCIETLEDAGYDVETRHLVSDELSETPDTAVVDLSQLTDRQQEVAAAAVEWDYLDADGANAERLAERLDISKATLSEHVRSVQTELLQQAFGENPYSDST